MSNLIHLQDGKIYVKNIRKKSCRIRNRIRILNQLKSETRIRNKIIPDLQHWQSLLRIRIHMFLGLPGSGSICQRYGSGSRSFYH